MIEMPDDGPPENEHARQRLALTGGNDLVRGPAEHERIAGLVMMARFNSARMGYGYSYLLLTVLAIILGGTGPFGGFGRVSGVVDIPNACCSLYLPTAILDFDITPSAAGPIRADRGACAVSS